MPHQHHEAFDPNTLTNTSYGFFTNERGSSTGGYVVNGEGTRNVNIYSPQESDKAGYDPAISVIGNLMACFKELTHGQEHAAHTHQFLMTSNYGKSGARILTCRDARELTELKKLAESETSVLELHANIQTELQGNGVCTLKADALVFKGIPGEFIAAGGASGDAHPIILIDDANKVCAYISGAHAALKEGVIEKTIQAMLSTGARHNNIHMMIGPGLGKNSYEFGLMKSNGEDITPDEYLNVPRDKVLKVSDPKCRDKWLVDIEKLVAFKAMGMLPRENVHNMDIDTMGFDLYHNGTRREVIDFEELDRKGILFFGARRTIMKKEGVAAQNPGTHNTVGRHFAGITLKG